MVVPGGVKTRSFNEGAGPGGIKTWSFDNSAELGGVKTQSFEKGRALEASRAASRGRTVSTPAYLASILDMRDSGGAVLPRGALIGGGTKTDVIDNCKKELTHGTRPVKTYSSTGGGCGKYTDADGDLPVVMTTTVCKSAAQKY